MNKLEWNNKKTWFGWNWNH